MNKELISKRLSEYIGSDIDDFLKEREAIVFGGAIRDLLSGEETVLNDVDILLSHKAMPLLLGELFARYKMLKDYIKVDMIEMYQSVYTRKILRLQCSIASLSVSTRPIVG